MQSTRKFIQTVRYILAAAVVMYLLVILRIPSSTTANPVMLRALGVLAIAETILIFVLRRIQVLPAEAALESQPQDPKALLRWRQGYVVTYSISLSIALYGLVLHFLGFSLLQILPFFLAGLALILFLRPRAIPGTSPLSGSEPIIPR
jgi:hypothetical protein